jgi:flagella basal body P-ring formation protein FlgA
MTFLIPLFLAASLPPGECTAIDTDTVVARDVAKIIPAFAQIPEDFLFGYVPATGAQRVFRAEELERIAKNRGLDVHGLEDICFVRLTFVPDATQIRAAMQKTIGIDGVKIEILSSSQQAFPVGELIFPRNGVQGLNGQEITWHGYVRAGENTRFSVWARANITVPSTRVVANENLPAGKIIQKDQVSVEQCEASPFDDTMARQLDDVIGMAPRATLTKSMPIRKSQVQRPMDVARGETVRVEVYDGAAHLSLEARAETSGMKGSTITLRNLSSGREFQAQITGKDQVAIGGRE